MHHRREGHLLTQTQEEMVLIVGFALFWMGTFLIATSVFFKKNVYSSAAGMACTVAEQRTWRWPSGRVAWCRQCDGEGWEASKLRLRPLWKG